MRDALGAMESSSLGAGLGGQASTSTGNTLASVFLVLGSRPPFLPAGAVLVLSNWKHPGQDLSRSLNTDPLAPLSDSYVTQVDICRELSLPFSFQSSAWKSCLYVLPGGAQVSVALDKGGFDAKCERGPP